MKSKNGHILRSNTKIWWTQEKLDWDGVSATLLLNLVHVIGDLLLIKPEHAEHIKVYFGDYVSFDLSNDTRKYLHNAFAMHVFDDNDVIKESHIVINRSKELTFYNADRNVIPKGAVLFTFESTLEMIIWLITEELHHAQVHFVAGTKPRAELWQKNYKDILSSMGLDVTDDYNSDLREVAASRVCLRMLIKLAPIFFPAREAYFRHVYQRSLNYRACVISSISGIRDHAYVETGFVWDDSKYVSEL